MIENGLTTSTYYVRDASGNTMSVYTETDQEETSGVINRTLALKEQAIYGSSRIGQYNSSTVLKEQVKVGDGEFTDITLDNNTVIKNTLNELSLPTADATSNYVLTAQFVEDENGEWTNSLLPISSAIAPNDINTAATVNTSNNEVAFSFLVNSESNKFILDSDGNLVATSEELNAMTSYAAMGIKYPGAANDYLLFTIGTDSQLYSHKINVTDDGVVTIAATNQLLSEGTYLNAMTVISDERDGENSASVFLLQNTEEGETTQVVRLDISIDEETNDLVSAANTVALLNDKLSVDDKHYFNFSGDGRKLALAINQSETAALYLYYYNTKTKDITSFTNNVSATGLTVNSLAWDADSEGLYYTTTIGTSYAVNYASLSNDEAVAAVSTDYQCSLMQGADGNMYVVGAGQSNIAAVSIADNTLQLNESALALSDADKTWVGVTPAAPLQLYSSAEQSVFERVIGQRQYEINDHLGNVRATISDKLNITSGDATYEPTVLTYSNYYPFGMQISSLSGNSGEYRFGFNGMEKDDEIKGIGNSYDFGARVYDPRIARWFSVDLFSDLLPNITPYRFGLNNPVRYSDLEGDFEIDRATAAAYPKLDSYLKNIVTEYANKPVAFKRAFKKYSELTDQQINTMLQYKLVENNSAVSVNQGTPRIIVEEMSRANGKAKMTNAKLRNGVVKADAKGTIKLDKTIVDGFKNNNLNSLSLDGIKLLIESTIFHEATHYGDYMSDGEITQTGYQINLNSTTKVFFDKTHGNGKIEGGKAFEIDAYGKDVGRGNADDVYKANNLSKMKSKGLEVGNVEINKL